MPFAAKHRLLAEDLGSSASCDAALPLASINQLCFTCRRLPPLFSNMKPQPAVAFLPYEPCMVLTPA